MMSNATIRGTAYLGYTSTAWCHACGHHQELDLEALAKRLGPDHGALHDDLVPHLKCSKCEGKNIGLILGGKGRVHRPEVLEPNWPGE